MNKAIFSIIAGALFALVTLLLVGIYWLFGLFARIINIVVLPVRGLFSLFKSA